MKSASSGFVSALNQPIRSTTKFQAILGVSLDDLAKNATVTYKRKDTFATGILDTKHVCDYVTFETDFLKVGSDQRILPDSGGYLENGFVSSSPTSANGQFSSISRPVITIALNSPQSFEGITFQFVDLYASGITVSTKLNGVSVETFDVTPDRLEYQVKHSIATCDTIEITFLGLNITGLSSTDAASGMRRLRVARITLGWTQTFNTSDIISVEHTMSIDPVSADLPLHHLSMKVINYDHRFNPDNPSGIWKYLTRGQPIEIRYGVDVNGETEWITADRLFLDDSPVCDENSVTFEAYDRLYMLTDIYRKGEYPGDDSEGYTMYELAQRVLADAGVTDYQLDDRLKTVSTWSPMPMLSHKECLQLIANASCCVLYTDKNGSIIFKAEDHTNYSPENYYLDFTKALSKPIVSQSSALKSVKVTGHGCRASIAASSRSKYEYINASEAIPVLYESSNDAYAVSDVPMSIRVEYNAGEPSLDRKNTVTGETVPHITAIVPNHSPNSPSNILSMIKFTRADIYARYAEIDVQRVDSSATNQRFGIQLAGTGLEEDNQVVEHSVSSNGEICEIDNPILAGTQQIKNVAEWAAAYLKNRNIYEVDFRQDFRLEPNDVITFQTQFEKNIPVRITRVQFKIPGQTGAICVRRLS